MCWLRFLPVLLAAMAIGCEKRSLDPDGGTGIIQPGTGNGGSAGGAGGPSTGSIDAWPDIPTIILVEPRLCGNGHLDPGEECDDGNAAPLDGCSAVCQIECFETCGACGIVGPCRGAYCGNGRLDPGEVCDDWNDSSGDGCSADCTAIAPGWRCPAVGHYCAPICGDGRVVPPETCDDSNTIAGDGCNEICVSEPRLGRCGTGWIEGAEECDLGVMNNDNAYGGCTTTCRWGPRCGDSVVNGTEECDLGADGNRARYGDAGGCTAFCTLPHFCGDGHPDVENGEQCDLGPNNGLINQGCTRTCKICIDC